MTASATSYKNIPLCLAERRSLALTANTMVSKSDNRFMLTHDNVDIRKVVGHLERKFPGSYGIEVCACEVLTAGVA